MFFCGTGSVKIKKTDTVEGLTEKWFGYLKVCSFQIIVKLYEMQ